ncbi:MAG: D-alanyl-D-alanine carboxypeptidase family protein [Oscillospiraceae bacterium]
MKKLLALIMALIVTLTPAAAIETLPEDAISIPAPHAVLMEKETGEIIFSKDADEHVLPASVTKIMTILLIVEALEDGTITMDDMVTASARARSMGGSQVYLADGESMTVRDMLKAIVVSSANDAAVAMAEHLCGTEEGFVARMNSRAKELGMENTNFNNCTGLFDDDGHYTSAMDVAVMSRELIKHDMIKEFTTIWMDSLRDGAFGLSNTNKLVRRYEGCTGLKTGYTSAAGHCLSATAERDGVEYIAVVMGCSSSDERFDSATALLNYAFANYALARFQPKEAIPPVRVLLGETGSLQPVVSGNDAMLLKKSDINALEYSVDLVDEVEAPVAAGQSLGKVTVTLSGEEIASLDLVSDQDIQRLSPIAIFGNLLRMFYGG